MTRFGGGAIDAGSRAALLFGEGESSVASAIPCRNGFRQEAGQLRGGIVSAVEFEDRDPKLRNIFQGANPDSRPKDGSPALPKTNPADPTAEDGTATGAAYVGAFGKDENRFQEWRFFGRGRTTTRERRMTGTTSAGTGRNSTPRVAGPTVASGERRRLLGPRLFRRRPAATVLATGFAVVPLLVNVQTAGPATPRAAHPQSSASGGDTVLPGEVAVDLQRQINALRSGLLDDPKRRVERRQ